MVRGPGFEPGLSAWKADVLVQARLAPLVIFVLYVVFKFVAVYVFLLFCLLF